MPRRHPKDPKAITTASLLPACVCVGTLARIGKLHVTSLNTRAKDGAPSEAKQAEADRRKRDAMASEVGQRASKGRGRWRTEFPWHANPTTSCSRQAAAERVFIFPPCFKERREQSGGSNGSATSVVQVRCRRAADGATATELYMICMPLQIGSQGWCQSACQAALLAFRDHSTPPNRTTERAGIIAVLVAREFYRGNVNGGIGYIHIYNN